MLIFIILFIIYLFIILLFLILIKRNVTLWAQMIEVQAKVKYIFCKYYFLYLDIKDYTNFVWHREQKHIFKESSLNHV